VEPPAQSSVSLTRLLFLALIAAGIVFPVRAWVVEPIFIPTASMEPTLPVGRHLFCDKLTLRRRKIERGDIVVFKPPTGEEEEMVKRVIGLPGETVELKEKAVYIDGKALSEDYIQHKRADEKLEGDTLGPVVVPENSYFVLGDNRDESNDSTMWKDKDGNHLYFVAGADVRGFVRGIY
jgi:signal peptidase I